MCLCVCSASLAKEFLSGSPRIGQWVEWLVTKVNSSIADNGDASYGSVESRQSALAATDEILALYKVSCVV